MQYCIGLNYFVQLHIYIYINGRSPLQQFNTKQLNINTYKSLSMIIKLGNIK